MLSDGRFWMWVWGVACGAVAAQGAAVILFWLDSVRAVNIMSVEALLLAVAAGFQSTLAMRKADREDSL